MQKDLFGASSMETAPVPKIGFLERHRFSFRLDQALIAFILLLVVYVLLFSFGVETGKRYAMAELKAERAKRDMMIQELSRKVFAQPREEEPLESKTSEGQAGPARFSTPENPALLSETSHLEKPSAHLQPPVPVSSDPVKKTPAGKYTIQVITFTSQPAAAKALKKFAEKGLNGFLIPAGKYLQLCVDSFESREKAMASLKHLKLRGVAPADAYVRVVPGAGL